MSDAGLELTLPATAENVIVVRQAIAGLAEALGLDAQRIADLKTVVTEACNNVVLHAYEGEPGPLQVTAEPKDDELVVEVADEGHGFRPRASEGEASLGLGLPLIAALSDSFEISGGSGQGSRTTIRFGYSAPDAQNNGKPGHGAEGARDRARPGRDREAGPRPGDRGPRRARRVLGGPAGGHGAARRRRLGVGRRRLLGRPGGISISDRAGTLGMRVGPLVKGGGERLMGEMDVPGRWLTAHACHQHGGHRGRDLRGRAGGVPRVRGQSVVTTLPLGSAGAACRSSLAGSARRASGRHRRGRRSRSA